MRRHLGEGVDLEALLPAAEQGRLTNEPIADLGRAWDALQMPAVRGDRQPVRARDRDRVDIRLDGEGEAQASSLAGPGGKVGPDAS